VENLLFHVISFTQVFTFCKTLKTKNGNESIFNFLVKYKNFSSIDRGCVILNATRSKNYSKLILKGYSKLPSLENDVNNEEQYCRKQAIFSSQFK
jgi:hypothetical protein